MSQKIYTDLDINGNVKSNSYKFNLPSSVNSQPNMLIPKIDGTRPIWYDNSSVANDLAFKSDVDNLQIGGRNLILNSNSNGIILLYGVTATYENIVDNQLPSKQYFKFTNVVRTIGNYVFYIPTSNSPDRFSQSLVGRKIQISFYIRSNNSQKLIYGSQNYMIDGTWQKVMFNTVFNSGNLHFILEGSSLTSFDISSVKIEFGDKATDWTPAPEDKQDRLQDITGNIGVGKIDTSATEKLDVNGNVKANGFKVSGGTATQSLTANGGTFDLNTKADLVDGKVPSAQLPSYVDDVLEFANFASFPATGENGKIYVALDTNLTYRWSGSTYAEISPSLALGETSTTAYRGDRGKIAYDHSQTIGNPHGTTKADIGLGNVNNTSDLDKPISSATQTALDTKLNLSGGTMTGALNFKNGTWNNVGDDAAIGDINVAGQLGIKALNTTNPGIAFYNNSAVAVGNLISDAGTLQWSGNTIWHSGNFNPNSKSNTDHTHTFTSITSKPTTLSGYGITDGVNAFLLPQNGASVSYVKIAELTTNIGAGENGLILYLNGISDFGNNMPGVDILQVSTRGSVNLKVYRLIPSGTNDVLYGYVNNGSTGKTEIWLKRDVYNYGLNIIVANARDATYGNLLTQGTEPSGITYVTKETIALTTDNVSSASKLQTPRTLTIGNTGKLFDGSGNVSWSLAEIGAQPAGSYAASSHTHDAADITSGTLSTARLSEFINNKYTYQTNSYGSGGGVYMPMVKGGLYTSSTSTVTGRLRIKLPSYRTDMMISFIIDVYEYDTDRFTSYYVSGYNYSDAGATWYNTSAIALADSDNRNLYVRFGADTTNSFQCVSIGETDTSWTYPQVVIRDVMGGYSTETADILNTWTIEFVTTDGVSYSHSHITNQPIVDWSRIVNAPSTFTPSSHTHDDRYYTEGEVGNFFSGATAITGYNKSNWNTAYGWGNHASAGYATQSWVQSQGYLTSVSDVWVNTSGDTMTGALTIQGGWASTILDGDNVVLRKPNYSSGGWARTLLNFQEYTGTSLFQIGGYGSNNTMTYGYLGSAHNNPTFRWYADKTVVFDGLVGIGVIPTSGDKVEIAGTLRVHTGNNWDGIQVYADGQNGYIRGIGDEIGLHIRSEHGNVYIADDRGVAGVGGIHASYKFNVEGAVRITGALVLDDTTSNVIQHRAGTDVNTLVTVGHGGFDHNGYLRIGGADVATRNWVQSQGYITGGYLSDFTSGNLRFIADYGSNATWFIRSNGQFIFGNAHDWTQSFRLSLSHDSTDNGTWAYFGQQDSNATNGRYRGVRIRKYAGGVATDGDLSAGAFYIGTTRKDTNWDTAYSWGNHASAGYALASGTANYIPKFTASGTIGNSLIYDNGTSVGIGTTALGARLDVRAQGALATDIAFRVRNSTDTQNFLVVNGAGDVYNNGAGGINTNTFFGENVGRNTTGGYNTAIGLSALQSNTTGFSNTAIGLDALYNNTTGGYNTAIGLEAGRSISDGSSLTIINNSIFIGFNTRALADNQTNQIVIGHQAIGLGSNSVVLGNDSITKTILKGNVGIGTTSPSTKLDVNGWATFLGSSGNRLKIWDGTDNIPTISADNLLALQSPTIQFYATDVTDSNNNSIYLKLKTVNGNVTIDNSYHNKIVRITASCTITIPAGLRTDFNCTFEVIGAYTAQFVDGSGATTSAPFGRYLKTDLTAMFYCTGTASNYRLNGSLTTS